MSKLYVGNLPGSVTEEGLRRLFADYSVTPTRVVLKRGGYAFVDCGDQSAADRAIDKLNDTGANVKTIKIPDTKNKRTRSGARNRKMKGGSGDMEGQQPAPSDDVNGFGQSCNSTMYNSWQQDWYSIPPCYPPYPRANMRKHSKSMSGGGGGGGSGTCCRVLVTNIPSHVNLEEFENFLQAYGTIQSFDKANSRDPQSQSVHVTLASNEQAQHAMTELNGMSYEGSMLKAELAPERKSGKGGGRGGNRGGSGPPQGYAMGGGSIRQTDFPLRILVQSDMVGAIIGRQGSTIRLITQQSRARVDVHRKDNVGSLEKAITIYGNPDNCTNACKRILEVMKQEAQTNNKGEITLKILAHNNLIGRIIGKAGNTIKRIMQETDTKITVSSINDINSFNLERIITVKGNIDSMSKAESMISAKLRQSYENDLQAMAPTYVREDIKSLTAVTGGGSITACKQPQSMMFPGLHPMAMMATSGIGYRGNTYQGGLYSSAFPPMYQPTPPPHAPDVQVMQETTCLYIPNNAVGAIIGTKGSHIRNMIRFSGASVKIAPIEGDKGDREHQPQERKVTIVGSPESQWKAQYLIFEKMREEGFVSGSEDVRLTVEILVPSTQVGRIIGKGGQNVRELQRVTGSVIKLPEQGQSPQSQEEETTVHIIGPFFSVQSAQRRIRSMVMTPGGGSGGGGGGGGGGGRSSTGRSSTGQSGSAQPSGASNQSQSQTSASQS